MTARMAKDTDFQLFIQRILKSEGGYVDDPNDPGGETQWGISKRSYPNVDIKNLTRDGAISIYKRDFWDVILASEMYVSIAFVALDFAVNSGIQTAIRKLQSSVGAADDGHWGPESQRLMLKFSEPDVGFLFLAERLEYRAKLKSFTLYGAGWTNREATNCRYTAQDTEDSIQ